MKELGTQVDPERDHIMVEGRPISTRVEPIYIALHKPRGYVTTRKDPHATHTVMDLIRPPLEARFGKNSPAVDALHPVGRLDAQSEGLLLLTNDGAFTNAVTHPSHRITKLYVADVRGIPDQDALDKLRSGVPLFGQRTLPARVTIKRADRTRGVATLEVELREGRQQQVRRMLQAVGHPVDRLKRVAVGPVKLDRLKLGQWRFLMQGEVDAIFAAMNAPETEPAPTPRPRKRPDHRQTSVGRQSRDAGPGRGNERDRDRDQNRDQGGGPRPGSRPGAGRGTQRDGQGGGRGASYGTRNDQTGRGTPTRRDDRGGRGASGPGPRNTDRGTRPSGPGGNRPSGRPPRENEQGRRGSGGQSSRGRRGSS